MLVINCSYYCSYSTWNVSLGDNITKTKSYVSVSTSVHIFQWITKLVTFYYIILEFDNC